MYNYKTIIDEENFDSINRLFNIFYSKINAKQNIIVSDLKSLNDLFKQAFKELFYEEAFMVHEFCNIFF